MLRTHQASRRVGLIPVLLLACAAASAAPVVFWQSDPIAPGEAVMLVGEGFTDAPMIEVARLEDAAPARPDDGAWSGPGEPAEVLQAGDGCVKFALPTGLRPGVFGYRVQAAGESATGLLNRPVIWWAQGDLGHRASPGGWLRVLGKNLGWKARPESARTTLLLRGPREVALPAEGGPYSAQVTLPDDLPPGEYEVLAHNGCGGDLAWSAPVRRVVHVAEAWPDAVLNVVDFDADPTGRHDSTRAVQDALAAAEAAGGGVVYLPRGRYQVTAGLVVPRFTTLRGEGRELTALLWPDTDTPPPALIQGTNSFAVEDLTVYATRYVHAIQGDLGDQPDAGQVKLRRLRVRVNAYVGHLETEEVDERLRAALTLSTGGGDTVRLGGEGIEVSDCDLYGSGRVLFLSRTRGGVVRNNALYNGRWGWYCISGSDGLILEGNRLTGGDLMSTGGGLNCLDGSTCSQNVYYAGNSLSLMHGWDREAMTSDAGGGAYFGGVESAEGTTLTLAADPETGGRDWAGGGVFVLDGRGRGQYRRIVALDGRRVTVDSPWQAPPDATSVISVTMLQRHYLFVDNRFEDAGVALQLYGMAIEDIADGNVSARTAGFHNFGMRYHGIQPSWYIQWLNNEIAEGNSYRSGHDNYQLTGEAHLGIFALPPSADFPHPLTLGCVARGNRLRSNAHLAVGGTDPHNPSYTQPTVQEVIVEGNEIADADTGVSLRLAASGVLLRNNRFTRVTQEVWDEAEAQRLVEERRRALLAEPGPLAVWRPGEAVGATVADASGHGFEAQIIGALPAAEGRRGPAARFGGTSYLRVEEPDLFNLPDVTLAAWINPDTTEGRHGLIGKRFAGTSAPYVFSLWDGGLEFEATAADGQWSFNFRSPVALKPGEWQHVAAVAEAGRGVVVYVNGQEVARKDNEAERVMNGEPLIIGREAWAGVNMVHEPCFYQGLIEEVKVWGRALTAEEVAAEALPR